MMSSNTAFKILSLGLLAVAIPFIAMAQTALNAVIVGPTQEVFQVGQEINFSAAVSGGTAPYSYVWNFGDGDEAFGDTYTKTYLTPGSYTVTLSVGDFASGSVSATKNITIQAAPEQVPLSAVINEPANNAVVNVGQAVNFRATASGGTAPYSYVWNFGDGDEAFGDTYAKTFTSAGSRTVTLQVGDFAGHSVTKTLVLTVQSSGGNNQVSVDLKANDANGPFTVGPNWVINLSWTSQNATSCSATGDWGGNKATSGTEQVTASSTIGVSHTYTLTCTGAGGSASDSVTVTVVDQNQNDPLTISNVRVTDITRTSAIVRWTTNRPATSRVIYDTSSHSSISGQAGPNYGYQFSTDTQNTGTGKVVEHAVSLTNLTANTHYYFRVISED